MLSTLNALRAKFQGNSRHDREMRRRRRNVFEWSADPLELRLVPSSIIQNLEDGAVVTYDNERISRLRFRGQDILVGGGIYLIGSVDGRDVRETNLNSIESKNGRMMSEFGQVGPRFELKFSRQGPNRIGFVAFVGPAGQAFEQMSLAFDFDKSQIDTFAFSGTRLKFTGTGKSDGWHDARPDQLTPTGSRWRFREIPVHMKTKDVYGHVLPATGTAFTRADADKQYARLSGPNVKIEVVVTSSQNYRTMALTNSFASNSFGFGFGPLQKGESARVEGYINIIHR